MNTYIQKDVHGFYYETEEQVYNIGYTYEDFLDGKNIKLEEEQVLYHHDYPESDISEVLNVAYYIDGEITYHVKEPEITVDSVKADKLLALEVYDSSDAVNDFTVNGTIHGWFDANERASLKNSVESAKLLGVEELGLFVGETYFTLPTNEAEIMLARLQLYADTCFNVTKSHKIRIENLDTIEAIQNYDFATGYPQKLNFVVESLL